MSAICQQLHRWALKQPRLSFPFDERSIPRDGIYLLFERGEMAHGGERIVRVGTHTGDHQLRSRLRQHFIAANKDRSIFRKHVGRCLLNRDHDPFLKFWELDLTSKRMREQYQAVIDHARQQEIEQQVTTYIQQAFSFIVVTVASKEDRLLLESKLVSTLSSCEECTPSATWLGQYAPNNKVRTSGLWQVNELYKLPLSAQDLKSLQARM